jgi:hypothetical protein
MAGPSRVLGFLIGVALLAFAGTASADNDHKAPEVAGTTATDITSSGATLRGTVNPNKRSTTYRFQYGRTQAYGSLTSQASAGDGEAALPVSAVLSGLTPSTTYHYRLVATNDKGTTLGQSKTFTTLAASTPSDPGSSPSPGGTTEGGETAPGPQLGKSVLIAPGAGRLLVRKPGTTDFEALELGSALPMGTEVDASAGSLALTSALPGGATQTGHFGGGRFVLRQGRRGYLDLYLRGRHCSPARASTAGVASAAAKSKRRLWGRDHGGRFRTHGKNSHATVRGTRWVVSDSCHGTLTRVTNGSVVVTDKVRDKRVLLEAGERYLARPRR